MLNKIMALSLIEANAVILIRLGKGKRDAIDERRVRGVWYRMHIYTSGGEGITEG